MPLSREQKEVLVASYQEGVACAAHAFLVDYRASVCRRSPSLRDKIRESGGEYMVVKNRLASAAIEGAAIEGLKEHFEGHVCGRLYRRRSGGAGQGAVRFLG